MILEDGPQLPERVFTFPMGMFGSTKIQQMKKEMFLKECMRSDAHQLIKRVLEWQEAQLQVRGGGGEIPNWKCPNKRDSSTWLFTLSSTKDMSSLKVPKD
jgi:hypothetical protein